MRSCLVRSSLLWAFLLSLVVPLAASAESPAEAQEERIRRLEEKVEVLTGEITRAREEMGVPEEKPLGSSWGLGPAASKVYGVTKGLSLGGYAEAVYTDVISDRTAGGGSDRFDFLRTVLYTGYKFTDWLLFNAEFEFEHASTSSTGAGDSAGGGSVSVEFATLDFLLRDELNLRAGLLLLPLGFVNELHEPPFYYGNKRPEVETRIIPSTLRENGAGVFGRVADMLEYKLYATTGLNGAGFNDAGLRGGRQRGNRALAQDWSFVGRVDFEPIPELLLGGSVMVGEADQDQSLRFDSNASGTANASLNLPNSLLTLWETHAQFQSHGFHARALFTMAHVDDARRLSTALVTAGENSGSDIVAREMLGVYGEVAYELMQWIAPNSSWTVEPFFRFEHVDTQNRMPNGFSADRSKQFQVYTSGLSVKPIPNVVLKIDHRNLNARRGKPADEINLGFGLVF